MTTGTQSYTSQLVVLSCCECHTMFGMANSMYRLRQEDGHTFCCPAGHKQHFGENENKRLQRQVAQLSARNDQLQATVATARQQRDYQKRCAIAQKGAKTRLKNRVLRGVCPCCNRSFENLRRHIENKHPEEAKRLDIADEMMNRDVQPTTETPPER